MTKRRSVAVAALVATFAARASAQTPQSCVAESDRAQALREAGKLTASRTALLACASDACPPLVRSDCMQWLADLDQRLPSVIFAVRDAAGRDALGSEVVLDGTTTLSGTSGRPVVLDPGEHVLRARRGAATSVEEHVVVRERDKDRLLTFTLREPAPVAPAGSPPSSSRSIPTASWIFGGGALVGLGAFAYFWTDGVDTLHGLRTSCAPACTDDQVDDATTPLTIARVALGASIVSAALAVTFYFVAGPKAKPAARLGGFAF